MDAGSRPDPADLYENFFGPAIFRPLAEAFVEFVAPAPGERMLDLACGTGMVARRAAPLLGEAGSIVGVDLNPGMLAVARRLAPSEGAAIEWLEGDAVELELGERAFDVATCQQGLQFFSDREAALRRLRERLAPGGRLGVAVWQGIDRQTLVAELTEIEARHLAPLGVGYEDLIAPFALGDEEELGALLERSGFSRVRVEPVAFRARFTDPPGFIRKMETAYGAVIPAFVEDEEAFEAYVTAVEREGMGIVTRFADGDRLHFDMPAFFAMGHVEEA